MVLRCCGPTAAISDALGRASVESTLQGIAPPVDEFRAAGPGVHRALRLDGQWGRGHGRGLPRQRAARPVVVIDNDGRTDVTVWGLHDIAGTVINGVCRDVSASLSQNYPLFSRGRFMRTGKEQILKIRAAHGFAATYGPTSLAGAAPPRRAVRAPRPRWC